MKFARPCRRRSTRAERGLTLVEIMVVLIVLAILGSFLFSSIFSQGEQAKAKVNDLRMTALQQRINMHQLQNNTLPPDLGSIAGIKEDELKDAWGTPFVYTTDGRTYTLKSLGSDRRDGGADVAADVQKTGP